MNGRSETNDAMKIIRMVRYVSYNVPSLPTQNTVSLVENLRLELNSLTLEAFIAAGGDTHTHIRGHMGEWPVQRPACLNRPKQGITPVGVASCQCPTPRLK